MEILEPWSATSDVHILDEFRREMAPGHVLEDIELSPVARRKDCDDVLFALDDGSGRFAVVHLTFSKSRERDSRFPRTWFFKDRETFFEYMEAAHAVWAGEREDPDGQLWLKEQRMLDAARKF